MKKYCCEILLFSGLLLAFFLAGCGGGGDGEGTLGGGDAGTLMTNISAGVAVDPYIVNAQFEEIAADGKTVLQRSSSLSDSQGRFSFPKPISENSTIRLKASQKGMHVNAPYTGLLKRRVTLDDEGPVVVSPLTTLEANGMSPAEILDMLTRAGLPGLTESDIYADPMAALVGQTGRVSNGMLGHIQSSMAANCYMEVIGDFNYGGIDTVAVTLDFADMVSIVQETLSEDLFDQLVLELGNDFRAIDLIHTAAHLNRVIVSQVRQELATGTSSISQERLGQIVASVMQDVVAVATEIHEGRVGSGTNPDPEPEPEPTPEPDPGTAWTGEELYVAECQGCHGSLQTTNILDRTASGIQAAIDSDAGGMGAILLTSEEIQLIVDILPVAEPSPEDPPQYRNGEVVYDQECAVCHKLTGHDETGDIDLASMGSAIVIKIESGHQGIILPAQELTALADYADAFSAPEPIILPRDSQTVYDENCAGCHLLFGYDDTGSIDLAGMGSEAAIKVASGHGGTVSTEELTNLANWLDSWAPAPPPQEDRSGQAVYDANCGGCHLVYGYDATGSIDLASMGDSALNKIATGHGGTMTDIEALNLADWLDSWAPAPPPQEDRSGQAVYDANCAGCHLVYGYDATGSIDLASMGDSALSKVATGHGGAMTDTEALNLADWLDTWSPAPAPVETRSGEAVYNDDCAACHKVNGYDADGSIDLAGQGDLVTAKLETGHGTILSVEEQSNLVNWLNTFEASDPYAGSCDTCHGQPPAGTVFPDTAGTHSVHDALQGITGQCDGCHLNAVHNDWVDLDFAATWDAKSGPALDNGDGTCSNIICHGGVPTPAWSGGLIDVETQCKSCHLSGTTQYNSYSSGKHDKHVRDKKLDCTACHDPDKLRIGHFDNLATRAFEQAPSATILDSLSYENGSCGTVSCHGDGKKW